MSSVPSGASSRASVPAADSAAFNPSLSFSPELHRADNRRQAGIAKIVMADNEKINLCYTIANLRVSRRGRRKGGTKTDLLPFARNVGAVEPDVQADASARAKKMAVKAWV